MNREETEGFVNKTEALLSAAYIVAEVRISAVLQSIASSETLIALFKSCLTDFDYEAAKDKYFVKDKYSEMKGEFILPDNPKEIIALVFNLLMDIDGGRVSLGELIERYFYDDCSVLLGYNAFLNGVIKPFKDCVVNILEQVESGKVQDPKDAITERERLEEKKNESEGTRAVNALIKAKKLIETIVLDKKKVKESKLSDEEKNDGFLIIDTFESALRARDKEAINYAFTAYKYFAKAHPVIFYGRVRKVQDVVKEIVDEL